MRVLSVKQPWSGLLMAGEKRFEVRGWRPVDENGLVLIHASSNRAPISDLEDVPLFRKALRTAGMADKTIWPLSMILGVAEFVRVHRRNEVVRFLSQKDKLLCGATEDRALWRVGRTWAFSNPIPCDGKLNLWQPDTGLRRRIERELSQHRLPRSPWLEKYTRRP